MDTNKTSHGHDIITTPARIIGHASASIPIVSDGFGSPHTLAQSPLGVITKTDTRIAKGHSSHAITERYLCINCRKRDNCICKECVRHELKFYSRKESIAHQKKLKHTLDSKITEKFLPYHEILSEINNVTANIEQLHRQIAYVKERKQEKEIQIETTLDECKKSTELSRMFEGIFVKHEKKIKEYEANKKLKRLKLDKRLNEIWVDQVKKSLFVLNLFRIKQLLAEPVTVESPNNDHWMMVNGVLTPEKGMIYKIGEAKMHEASQEKLAACSSTINLPFELRLPFAALLHTVQVLSMLTMLYEFSLPNHISYREIAIRDMTSKEDFHNDWNTICELSMCLGLHIGLSYEKVNYNDPLSNLLEIGKMLYQSRVRHPPNGQNKNHHYRTRTTLSKLHKREQEMKDWDVLDISEVQEDTN